MIYMERTQHGLYAPAQDLMVNVLKRSKPAPNGCLVFTGATNSSGYGVASAGRRHKTALVHRLAVLADGRDIPDEMTVDHLCNNKLCVNPGHLEVVSRSTNCRRGNHSPERMRKVDPERHAFIGPIAKPVLTLDDLTYSLADMVAQIRESKIA